MRLRSKPYFALPMPLNSSNANVIENRVPAILDDLFRIPYMERASTMAAAVAHAATEPGQYTNAVASFTSFIQWASIIVTLGIAVGFFIIVRKHRARKNSESPTIAETYKPPHAAPTPRRIAELLPQWEHVIQRIDSLQDAEWKVAIIDADKIVDGALRRAGYEGESMGDRLMKMTQGDLASLDDLWMAHKIRNKLVHEPGYQITYQEARRTVKIFEKVLGELGMM